MCDLCRVNPLNHSFDYLTEVSDVHVFYTSFRHVLDYSSFNNIRNHMDHELSRLTTRQWIWIVDAKHLASKHMAQMSVTVSMIKYLRTVHNETLANIYLLNGGLLIKAAFKTLMPFINRTFYNSIVLLQGTRLELLMKFQARGWTVRDLEPLLARLLVEYS